MNGYQLRLLCYKTHPWIIFFLIYINDLSDNLLWTVKLFADNTLFSVVNGSNISANELIKICKKYLIGLISGKRTFNPDSKHAQEVIFSRKIVVCANWKKHLGMFLNESLNFSYHIKDKMSKAMKGIRIIKKLNKTDYNNI